jgi:hypothetical protein
MEWLFGRRLTPEEMLRYNYSIIIYKMWTCLKINTVYVFHCLK